MSHGSCGCTPYGSDSDRRGERIRPIKWNARQQTNPGTLEEEDKATFNQGFAEGFKKAREVFWLEFQIKASDANMVAQYINEKDPNSIDADSLRVIGSTYLHAADVLLRDRREYPGYSESENK